MDGLNRDVEFLGTDDEIGVSGGSKGVSDDQEGDIDILGVMEDGIGLGLDHLTVCDGDGLAVELFLARWIGEGCVRVSEDG